MKNFNELPESLQGRIREYLRAYDTVHVTYENGTYYFGTFLKKTYAPDFEPIGTFKAKDIFTEEERILNYVNSFHDYPIQYKGKKDYRILSDYKATYKMVNGNIELA